MEYIITHTLPGYDKTLFACSCGNQIHINDRHPKSDMKCPKCGNDDNVKLRFNNLTFGNQEFSREYVFIEEEDKDTCYKFYIDIFLITNAFKMNFKTKTIKLLNESYRNYRNLHYRIYFNGHAFKTEDMITIIDMYNPNNKINSIQELKEIIKSKENKEYIRNNIEVYKRIKNSSKLFSTNSYYYANKIKDFLDKLEKEFVVLIPFCKANEKIIKVGIDPEKLNNYYDSNKETINDILKLPKYLIKELKDNPSMIRNYQVLYENLKDNTINYMNTFGQKNQYDIQFIFKISELFNEGKISINKLYKYLYEEVPRNQGIYSVNDALTLYYDSYKMAKDLELIFDNKCKHLMRYHNMLLKEHNVFKDAYKKENFQEAVANYKKYEFYPTVSKKIMVDNEEVIEKIPDKYFIKVPDSFEDLIEEGKNMNHCVGGYVDRVIEKKSYIFFLRKTNEPDKSFCTIELDPFSLKIKQVKCRFNSKLMEMDAIKTIEKWCKKNEFIYTKGIH